MQQMTKYLPHSYAFNAITALSCRTLSIVRAVAFVHCLLSSRVERVRVDFGGYSCLLWCQIADSDAGSHVWAR